MHIQLERDNDMPLYLQIQQFLRQQIETGALPPQTRLPASRELAHDLGISRMTAVNAYAELEAEGLIVSRHGSGTYVAPPPDVRPAENGRFSQSPLGKNGLSSDSRPPSASSLMTRLTA